MKPLYRRRASQDVPTWFMAHSDPQCNAAIWYWIIGEEKRSREINAYVQFVNEAEIWAEFGPRIVDEWKRTHPGEPGPPIRLRLERGRSPGR